MSAEILKIIPTSGEFTESHFGESFNSQLWVKFTDNNFEEWAGCFSMESLSGLSFTLINKENTKSLIVAGGKGYLIDLDEKKLIIALDGNPLIDSAIRTSNPDYFVLGTFYSIYVLNDTGVLKEIRPDTIIDGIYFKKQTGNKAIGELASSENQYKNNVDFEFDLTTFELKINY